MAIKKGSKVSTPDGVGTVETVADDLISGTLENKKSFQFRPRFVEEIVKGKE